MPRELQRPGRVLHRSVYRNRRAITAAAATAAASAVSTAASAVSTAALALTTIAISTAALALAATAISTAALPLAAAAAALPTDALGCAHMCPHDDVQESRRLRCVLRKSGVSVPEGVLPVGQQGCCQ